MDRNKNKPIIPKKTVIKQYIPINKQENIVSNIKESYSILFNLIKKQEDNNIYNNNNNNENDKLLFFKVWNNLFLKKKIQHYLQLYIKYGGEFLSLDKNKNMEILYNHPFKEYICKLYLSNGFKYDSGSGYPIPNTVSTISYGNGLQSFIDVKDLPDSITSLEYNGTHSSPLHITGVPPSILHLNIYNSCYTKKGDIPFGLKSITIGYSFSGIEFLPSSVKKMDISSFHSGFIRPGELPSSLETLKIEWYDKPLIPGDLPNSITFLEISKFNQKLNKNSIPKNVKTLILPSFNQILDKNILPNSITSLQITSFNQELGLNILPPNLEYLEFGKFNKQLKSPIGILPSTIKTLILGTKFNNEIEIPKNVSTLKFGGSFSQALKINSIPPSVTSLVLNANYKNIISKEYIPNVVSLKYLTIVPPKPKEPFIKGKMYNGR